MTWWPWILIVWVCVAFLSVVALATQWYRDFSKVSRGELLEFIILSLLCPPGGLVAVAIIIVRNASGWWSKPAITAKKDEAQLEQPTAGDVN